MDQSENEGTNTVEDGTADDTEDTKFIDMNSFLDVSCDVAVKLEAEIDNESRASPMETALEPDSCVKCTKYSIQLHKSNMKVKFLENQVRALKMKIEFMMLESKKSNMNASVQPAYQKCKLCYKKLTGREVVQHLCIEHRTYIQCPYCLSAFITTKDLLDHISAHGKLLAADRKRKFYKCEICCITYSMQILLECHKMAHVAGHIAHGIPFDAIFENFAIIKPEELDQSKNFKQTIVPNQTQTTPAPVASLAYANLVTNLKDVMNKFFKCAKCQESFETPQELKYHVKLHEKPPIPVEVPAKKRKPNKGAAISLTGLVTQGKKSNKMTYECYLCHLKYQKLGALHKHMNAHAESQKIVYHFCSICRMRVDRTKMDRHVCGAKDNVQCEYCTECFTGTTNLLRHLDEMHKTKRRLYQCEKCVKHFPMVFLKDFHQESHADEPEEYMKQLKGHTSNSERTKDHLCEECGKTFSSVQQLALHKQSSFHSEPSVECPDCSKKFYTTKNYKRHWRKCHSESKVIMVCDICEKEFHTTIGLRNHKKTHTRTDADRVHACKLCPQKFFHPRDLKKHEVKHMDLRQYQCELCDISYKYKTDLWKHSRTHHIDGKIYECTTCHERFKYALELQRHSVEHYQKERTMNQEEIVGDTLNG